MWHRQLSEHEKKLLRDFERDEGLQVRAVALCAAGLRRGLIISGLPGSGKSTRTRRVLDECGAEYAVVGTRLTPTRAYKAILKHRRGGLVLDDCDDLVRSVHGVEIIKTATERPPRQRWMMWGSSGAPRVWPCDYDMTDEEIAGLEVDKEGRVFVDRFPLPDAFWLIIITNLRLAELARKHPNLGIPAMLDRMDHLPQHHWDADSMMLRIERLAAESAMFTKMGLDLVQERDVLEFLRDNRRKFASFSLRTAEKVAEARRDLPDIWQEFSLACQ
jgi:hypothetical protein